MQRGAYESMSMEKPIIISDWPVLRNTFYKGAVYVYNEKKYIRKGILSMIDKKRDLKLEISELREHRLKIYEEKIGAIQKLILNT